MANQRLKCAATVLVTAALGLCASYAADETASTRAVPDQPVRVVPWLELGPDRRLIDQAVEGLLAWQKITDTAIVSVDPAGVRLYRQLRERVPGMRIIPGLKTSPVLVPAGFDSPEGWRRIATAAAEARKLTGSKVLLLENESAIQKYIDGKQPLDLKRLRTALNELPSDGTILWYPSAAMNGEILNRYLRMCRVAAELPNLIFVDHAMLYGPRAAKAPGTRRVVQALRELARKEKPPVPLIYCCGGDTWPKERVLEAIRMSESDWMIIYPGQNRWVETARYLAEQLPPFEPPTKASGADPAGGKP